MIDAPKPITIYDMVMLQNYFATKVDASDEDKQRANKLNEHICVLVDGLKLLPRAEDCNDILLRIMEIMPPKNGAA